MYSFRRSKLSKVGKPPLSSTKTIDDQYSRGVQYWTNDSETIEMMADRSTYRGNPKIYYVRKVQIANPFTRQTKVYESSDALYRIYPFVGKRIGECISGDLLNIAELAGCKFKITAAINNNGKPFHPSIMKIGAVRPLIRAGEFGFQKWERKRDGERRRRTVMGCFLDRSVSAVSLKLIESPQHVIPGLNDNPKNNTLGPKRASKIRKLFNLTKQDDVRKYVIKRNVEICKKSCVKGVKIQRLITPERIRRKEKQLCQRMKRNLRRSMERKEFERKYKKKL